MQINQKYEKELNLRDLFFHILYHWRSILAVAIVIGIAFGLLGGMIGNKKVTEVSGDAMENYEYEKKKLEENVDRWLRARNINREYLDNSLYMKLDGMHTYCARRRYLVQVDLEALNITDAEYAAETSSNVLQVYGYVLEQDLNEQELMEAFGTSEMIYIREIAKVEIDSKTNQIMITVMSTTSERAEKGCDYLGKKVEELTEKAQEIAAHKFVLVSKGTFTDSNKSLVINQQDNINLYNEYNTNYENAVNRLNALKMPTTSLTSKNEMLARGLIGFIAGFIVMIFVTAIRYLFSGRLHNGRDLSRQYTLPIFGEFKQSRAWRSGKGIDKLIEKWEFRSDHRTDESVYCNIAALIQDQPEVKKVALISTLPEKEGKPVQERLQSYLEGAEVKLVPDFLSSGCAVSETTSADAALVLEKKNKTRNVDLNQMAGMLQVSSANIIGAIVL